MSWTQQQGPPVQQQTYPPPTSTSAVTGVAQTTTGYVSQQQWRQQQQFYKPQQQQQNSMHQQQQQATANQNNWFSPSLNPAVPMAQLPQQLQHQPAPQEQQPPLNNWQQQSLQPAAGPPTNSSSGYFNKLQPSPQVNNFLQQNPAQYQPIPTYPSQQINQNMQHPQLSNMPTTQHLIDTNVSQNFLNTEQAGCTVNSQQHHELFDNQQNQNPPPQQLHNNENWENEWEWNENNQQHQSENTIEDSFKNEPNDNWQWGMDEQRSPMHAAPSKAEIADIKNVEISNSLEIITSNHQSLDGFQTTYGANVVPLPLNQHQSHPDKINLQSMSLDTASYAIPENIQTPNSSVYVSQAKPVAQPSKQYASPPAVNSEPESSITAILPTPAAINQISLSHPINSQSPGVSNLPPPPAEQTAPPTISASSALPPPPPLQVQDKNGNNNPFKRSGLAQHHRATGLIAQPKNSSQPTHVMPSIHPQQLAQFYTPPPDEFQNQQISTSPGNQEFLIPENSEVILDRAFESLPYENLEVAPSNDRNQYLQTSHLSEEGFSSNAVSSNTRVGGIGGHMNELDSLPPPGLSRYVLGQPELENINSGNEIPPGFDRMVPGTDIVSSSSLNLERQADGQDTIPSPRSAFTNVPPVQENDGSSNLDITTDRNLYLVPGKSEHHEQQMSQQQPNQQQQRVVTGLENETPLNQQSSSEQREVELDGENLEDEPQTNQSNYLRTDLDLSVRDEPIEGANTLDSLAVASSNQQQNSNNNETESSLTIDTHPKDLSNPSTGNDESDNRNHFVKSMTRRVGTSEDKLKKRSGSNKEVTDKRKERYDSEESDLSNDRERRRFREGSARNDRSGENRDSKEKDRRDNKREGNGKSRGDERSGKYERAEKDRNIGSTSKRSDRDRRDRERERGIDKYEKNDRDRSGRYAGSSRYETDSKYETEGSRYERTRKDGNDREHDRDRDRDRYDDYRRDEKENRKYRNRDVGVERHADERRSDRRRGGRDRGGDRGDFREDRTDRNRNRSAKTRPDYEEEYRKGNNGSRNTRNSDHEKDRSSRAIEKDARYAQLYGYPQGYNYDPYVYYQQQQQYYEKLRRTNPQAYAEWYRKYYATQVQPTDLSGLTTTDGRESVHSGRSSANNEKDRYSLQHHQQQYIPHHSSDYHRHFVQQSNVSSTPNVSMIVDQQHQQLQTFHNFNNDSKSSSNLLQAHHHDQYQTNHLLHNSTGGYLGGGINSSTGYGLRSYCTQSEYSESRPENLSVNLIGDSASSMVQDPQRVTPFKFTNDHSTVSMSVGLLVCVKPKYAVNGTTNIVKLLRLSPNDSTRRLFQSFPGPLIRGLTNKKTIIEFCEDQIRLGPSSASIRSLQNSMSSLCSTNQVHKESFTLMWNLLILLLRQNGMVVGIDIAELLMKNKIQFPYDVLVSSTTLQSKSVSPRESGAVISETPLDTQHGQNLIEKDTISYSDRDNKDDDNIDSNDDKQSHLMENMWTKDSTTLTEQQITEKFRNYLLYGNVNEALDWATDNNLWGHALFLASKVDRRSHANVMMKFANKLSLNDPLQTLYQLMSGRTPSSVTSIQDEKWGDWRPHLAMILSNTSQWPDLNRKAITTLGDSLYNRGDLFGAQFCYLIAQVGFGKYSEVNQNETTFMPNAHNAVRLILLGSSHHNQFREFATNEAIMMTEIYEYARSLSDDKFAINEFQPYKYLLANRMLDYGYQLKALLYMEQIAIDIQRDPTKYETSFIQKIYTLADRLKYFDPVLEKTMDEQHNIESDFNSLSGGNIQIEDQKWLKDLRDILSEYKSDFGQMNNEISPPNYQQQGTNYESSIDQNRAAIDQQFVEINQQFSKLTMQYNNVEPIIHQQQSSSIQQDIQQPITSANPTDQYPQFYNPNDVTNTSGSNNLNEQSVYPYMQPQHNQFDQQQQFAGDQLQQQKDVIPTGSGYGNYEYWDQQQQQQQQQQHQQDETQQSLRPTISLPNSSQPTKTAYYDNDDGGNGRNQNESQSAGSIQSKSNKTDNKTTNKSAGNLETSQNSGWFGGIWNKLSLKPKNQMILPDDKNPAIVWDADKKKWVNTDGEVEEQENFKPPPKMTEIMPIASPPLQTFSNSYTPAIHQQQNQIPQQAEHQPTQMYGQQMQPQPYNPVNQQHTGYTENYSSIGVVNNNQQVPIVAATIPSSLGEPTKTPNLQSNMFKMQRNRTLKKSYVDVFNPSGTAPKPTESVLAPAIPSGAVPQTGFFIPVSVSGENHSQQQQQNDGAPQYYNPNQFGGYQK